MKQWLAAAALAPVLYIGSAGPAAAQSAIPSYTGEVRLFGFSFCPTGWLQANGQLLQISSYVQLFALYGNTYGGNGTTNFAVPNLTGRAPVGFGSSPSGQPLGTAYGTTGTQPASNALAMNWCVSYNSTFPTRQ